MGGAVYARDLIMVKESPDYSSESHLINCEMERKKKRTGEFVDDVLDKVGFGIFQIAALCFVGTTYVAYICEVLTFSFISILVMKEWDITPFVFSTVSASTFIGNIVGEIALGYIADRYGRFWPYLISLIINSCLVVASAFAPNFYTFLILRMCASAGIGGIIVLSIPTLMEFLPINKRGNITILTSLIVAISSCAMAGIAWWLVPSYGWRYFVISTSVPSFFSILMRLLFYFESPRYLVGKGKLEKAWNTFRIMAKINSKQLDQLITKEEFMKEAKISLSGVKTNTHSLRFTLQQLSCILRPPLLRPTICLTVVFTLQLMVSYGTTLFLPYNLQVLGVDPYICSFIAFTAEIPGILFLVIVIEWPEFGRKNTIRISSFVLAVLYFLFAFIQNEVSISVLTVLIYFWLVPILTIIHIYIAETYPTEIRIMATAFITSTTSLLSIGLTLGAGYLADQSHKYPWLSGTIWGCAFVVAFIVSLFLNHETRGKNLKDTVAEVIN